MYKGGYHYMAVTKGIIKRKGTDSLRSERIEIRVTPFEKECIRKLAYMQGLGVSEYLRLLCYLSFTKLDKKNLIDC